MRGIFATFGLLFGIASQASAQLAPLDVSPAPAPVEGLAAVAATGDTSTRDAPSGIETKQRCEAWAREFRVRNTQSPSERQGALEACLAAAQRAHVEIAGP